MTDPLEHIRKLAKEIGPRPSTGEGGRQAAAYIAEQLERFGFAVKTEEFRSPSSFSYAYMLAYAISLIGFAAGGLGKAALGLLLTGIALIGFVGENTTALPLLSTVVPRGRSQNVVGRLVPRDLPRRRLIMSAHYDSAQSGLMFHPRLVRRFRLTFLVLTLSVVALPALAAAEVVTGQRVFWLVSIPFAAILAYAFLLLLHREIAFEHVAGANDNASGVAVMLSLAEAMSQDAPLDTEAGAVATGSEEAGLWGIQAFLKRHQDELSPAWLVDI